MAIATFNPLYKPLHGKVGGLVFKHYTDKIVVTRAPTFSGVWSTAQRDGRKRFALASAYARIVCADPLLRSKYAIIATRRGLTVRSVAISAYLHGKTAEIEAQQVTPRCPPLQLSSRQPRTLPPPHRSSAVRKNTKPRLIAKTPPRRQREEVAGGTQDNRKLQRNADPAGLLSLVGREGLRYHHSVLVPEFPTKRRPSLHFRGAEKDAGGPLRDNFTCKSLIVRISNAKSAHMARAVLIELNSNPMRLNLQSLSLVTITILAACSSARGDVINGSFETGDLTGWTATMPFGFVDPEYDPRAPAKPAGSIEVIPANTSRVVVQYLDSPRYFNSPQGPGADGSYMVAVGSASKGYFSPRAPTYDINIK